MTKKRASKRRYIGVTITGSGPLAEIIGERLIELGGFGVEERPLGAPAVLQPEDDFPIAEFGVEPPAETAVQRELHTAFDETDWNKTKPALEKSLSAIKSVITDLTYEWERLPELDVLARWRKDLKNFVLTSDLGVTPDRKMAPKDQRKWLVVPPRMAFGTGEHPTTRMAAKLTAEWTKRGDRVLDAGCGTGLLALVALARGAKEVLAIDIEEDAVRETRQNMTRNGYAGKGKAKTASILDFPFEREEKFDLILANIHLNVLKAWWHVLPTLLKPGGRVIATGLLIGQGRKLGRAVGSAVVRRSHQSWIVLGFKPKIQATRKRR